MDSSNQSNTGLLKFRSATSSLFDYGVLVDNKTTNSDSERLFSRFCDESESPVENSFRELDDKSTLAINQRKFGPGILPPHYPRQSLSSNENGSFGLVTSSAAMENHHQSHQSQVKTSLLRQSSSPAGLFSHIPNGYGDLSPSGDRLKTQLSFSPRLPSSPGMLSRISEDANESLVASPVEEEKIGTGNNGNSTSRFYGSGYAYSSWNDSFNFTENSGVQRRDQESNRKPCSGLVQNEEIGNRIQMLSHHLSLPKSSVEVEKYLHFQDSVPCKIRAKRGCATHPRSIAERVRRTRISERMRKLQELVPNMDKQTNTADMLDLAVDYIKDLQKQFKSLSDKRVNCKCIHTQNPISNQVV